MKKILSTSILLAIGGMLMAQTVQENAAAVVYYMPQTELVITLDYSVTHQTPGVFYQYAKRYLGAENVITEARSTYALTGVSTHTHTSADMSRAYQITPQKGLRVQQIALTADGRLLGYNIPTEDTAYPEAKEQMTIAAETAEPMGLMPLLEEQFMAGTTAKMAEGAAKQIYHIREMRLNMLVGDVEHVPADGQAMQLVLQELEKREQALVALFVGTTKTEHRQHTIRYMPNKPAEQAIICRFSQHSGVVDSDDLSGNPLYLQLHLTQPTLRKGAEPGVKGVMLSQLYYNLPAQAQLTIKYNGKPVCSANYPVAQLGVAIPLSSELFISKDGPIIHINPQTGNIQSIQQ